MDDTLKNKVITYISHTYQVQPEYPWKQFDSYAVFRHADNRKWFALVMDITRDKLGFPDSGAVAVVNLKIEDAYFRETLVRQDGILPAYHMNKQNWITVLLDGTVKEDTVLDLIDGSFLATASAKKKEQVRQPKEWIVPANPKYYDIEHAFDHQDEIDWKQGNGIKTGDTVYMYVASPVKAILYQCLVTETDIPYMYEDENLTIRALMTIKLLQRYEPDRFTFDVLKEEYGIYAVRGPRGIPNSLSIALNR